MLLQRFLLLLLCHGKPTEAQYGLIRDFLKYCSNLQFRITARAVVSASVWEMKLNLPDRLQNEPNHTVHDIHGVKSFVAFQHPVKISKMEFYKHVNT